MTGLPPSLGSGPVQSMVGAQAMQIKALDARCDRLVSRVEDIERLVHRLRLAVLVLALTLLLATAVAVVAVIA